MKNIFYKQLVLSVICCLVLFSSAFGNNLNKVLNTSNLESWVHGQYIGNTSLMSFFDNVTQPEILEYCTSNSIENFTVSYFWQDSSTLEFTQVGSNTINDVFSGFDVSTWSHLIENANFLNGAYFFQIILNNTDCGELVLLPIVTEEIEEEEPNNPIELPVYNCGDVYSYEANTNTTPLAAAASGDVFLIGGFPVLIETVSGSNGTFSGTGIIPLPFGKKVVSVSFNSVSVNDEFNVYAGSMIADSDSPGNYPDLSLSQEPLNIGGEICLPPPPTPGYDSDGVNDITGLNDWGFDPATGNHSNGTPYDDNGFDLNGIHTSTGTIYNENDCTREGLDINGNPCDPTGGPYVLAQLFADSIKPTLQNTIPGILDSLIAAFEAEIEILDCGAIRTEMDNLLSTLAFQRDFIFGESDKYFDKGMHQEFTKRPEELILNIERNQDAKDLESKHIELYDCDKQEYIYEVYIGALNELVNNVGYEDLLNIIIDKIANWTEHQYNIYANDPEAFNNWIIRELGIIMEEESGLDSSYGSNDYESKNQSKSAKSKMQSIFDFNPKFRNPASSTAALNTENLLSDEFTLEDLSFLYLQGDKEINGFHRALVMEEIAKQRMFMISGSEYLMPIEVKKTVGNKSYSIYLDKIVLTPSGASLDAYAVVEDAESGKRVVFGGENLSFGPTGLNDSSKLFLATDIGIRLNNAAMFILKGTPETYVEWDCEGFQSLGIDAAIEFCREYITPLDPTTLEAIGDTTRYRLDFKIQEVSSWLEFYAVINAPPFAVTQFTDVKWELTDMILDFSSTETPQFEPLPGYTSPFWDESSNKMMPAWKGFYMETLSATFPNSFSNNGNDITASANKVLIDGCGFTGGVSVENLINIDDGDLGGWPFSIDEFELLIIKNHFGGAGFGGQVNVPVFEENMEYEATMYPNNNYKFSVTTGETITMNMFLATGEITNNSKIEVEKDDEGFHAVATLHGKIDISTGEGTNGFNIATPSMCFQEFKVSNRSPYFEAGTWGMVESANNTNVDASQFNGFALRISNLEPYSGADKEAGLGLNIDLVLSEKIDIAAGGGFSINGELIDDGGRQKWIYKNIKVESFYVDASFPAGYVQGGIEWYGDDENPDPVWGQGFQGAVSAGFKGFEGISLEAVAMFGKKDDYKYFFIDAIARIGAGIPLGAIVLKGFGGGISNNMDTDQSATIITGTDFTLPPLGQTFSNTSYSPNEERGIGLKATVLVATLNEKIFNGMVSFSALFNDGGGLGKLNLTGSGQFMEGLDFGIKTDFVENAESPPPSVGAPLSCFIDIELNFDEPSFHGELAVFLNYEGIQGVGAGGKMVDAAFHFDPDKWYVYVGKPGINERCGIMMTIPGIGLQVRADSYLMVGTEVPPMAPLPPEVLEIAYMVNTNESLRTSGQGFVLGASVGFSIDAKVAGIIETSLKAQAGFDMMLRKYEGLVCEGSTDPVGIKGWYASGQLYAFITGKLAVMGVDIAEAGIAAVLQARLPNPFWGQATVGVKLKVGPLTFNKSLKLELGEDCTLVSTNPNAEVGMEIITFLEPYDGGINVETNAIPKAYFAVGLDKIISLEDINGNIQEFEAKLVSVKLFNEEGVNIGGDDVLADNKESLEYFPYTMMPGMQNMTFEVEVEIYKNGTFLTNEIKSVTFETSEAINYIPEANVKASYPVNGMVNFHKEEYTKKEGYLFLKSGQYELFNNVPEGEVQKIKLSSSTGIIEFVDFEYNGLQNKISFPLSPALLTNEGIYRLDLIQVPVTALGDTDKTESQNPSFVSTALGSGPSASSSPPGNYPANPNILGQNGLMYTMYFRVSKYNTFKNKIEEIVATQPGLQKDTNPYEPFGTIETNGNQKYDELISFSSNAHEGWLKNTIDPLFDSLTEYNCDNGGGYNPASLSVLSLNDVVGVGGFKVVQATHYNTGIYNFGAPNKPKYLSFKLEAEVKELFDLKMRNVHACQAEKLAYMIELCDENNAGTTVEGICDKTDALIAVMETECPPMPNGSYEVNVTYKIPGEDNPQVTSSISINFTK